MKKFIIRSCCVLLVCVISFVAVSCSENPTSVQADEVQLTERYVLNTNSKKIHKTTCGTGDNIAPRNREEYRGSIEKLKEKGYTLCGNCFR